MAAGDVVARGPGLTEWRTLQCIYRVVGSAFPGGELCAALPMYGAVMHALYSHAAYGRCSCVAGTKVELNFLFVMTRARKPDSPDLFPSWKSDWEIGRAHV